MDQEKDLIISPLTDGTSGSEEAPADFKEAATEPETPDDVGAEMPLPSDGSDDSSDISEESSENGEKKKIKARYIVLPFVIIAYIAISLITVFFTIRSGEYPAGDTGDAVFYIYRGDLMLKSIKNGDFFPLSDPMWYNGTENFRRSPPLPAYILAATEAIAGSDVFKGYLVFIGLLCFMCAIPWLYIGYRHDRPAMGAIMGALWFFIPNNLYLLYIEGSLAISMTLPLLPIIIFSVYDFINDGKWKRLITVIVCMIAVIMCHVGWAGMLSLTVALFLVFYRILNRKELRGKSRLLSVIVAFLTSFMVCGIWLYPSFKGAVEITDLGKTSEYYQHFSQTVNPLYGISKGILNRWSLDLNTHWLPYFGFAAFIIGVLGIFLSRRKTIPGFATAIAVCLLTSETAGSLLTIVPGHRYLKMLGFISIAVAFSLCFLLAWDTLKRYLQVTLMIVMALECAFATTLIAGSASWATPEMRYDLILEKRLADIAKEDTLQRFTLADPYGKNIQAVFGITDFRTPKPSSLGEGVEAAEIRSNIVQLNQSFEDECYLYLFDRYLDLGNDTLIIPMKSPGGKTVSERQLDSAAVKVGYELVDFNDEYRMYRLNEKYLNKNGEVEKNFGHISRYIAIGIGRSAPTISIDFPAVEETTDICINNYSYEELSKYEFVFLAGFTYTDKKEAEDLLIKLSENGTRVIIFADGIPSDEHTGDRTFLGVDCYTVNFKNGYPVLDTMDGIIIADLFPEGYYDWKTVYVNGLDNVLGSINDFEQPMTFLGTVKNDNIVIIGLNLSYHYALTKDPSIGALLSHVYKLHNFNIPDRKLVPLKIEYFNRRIEITSEYDNVCTTIAWHDIFNADNGAYTKNHLTYVNKGKTVITLRYPYLWQGLLITVAGLCVLAVFLVNAKKRWEDENPKGPDEDDKGSETIEEAADEKSEEAAEDPEEVTDEKTDDTDPETANEPIEKTEEV